MVKEKNVPLRIALDSVLILVVGLPIIAFYGNHFPPYRRGFFCDDDSIRYPYKYSTITDAVLYSVGISVPVFIIALTEFLRSIRTVAAAREESPVVFGAPVPQGAWRSYRVIVWFLFGACVTELTTDIAKFMIGRLRPHFLDVCKPDVDCATMPQHAYITKYTCTGDVSKIVDGRQSFPSGHSSISWYTMLFTMIYLQHRMTHSACRQLRPLLQFLLLLAAVCTCLSRVSDYKHHWSDVLAGSVFGVAMACAVAYCLPDLFTNDDDALQRSSDRSIPYDDGPDMKKGRYWSNLERTAANGTKGSPSSETVVSSDTGAGTDGGIKKHLIPD